MPSESVPSLIETGPGAVTVLSILVRFNPETESFTFFQDGEPHDRSFPVSEDSYVVITLEGASFSSQLPSQGINWLIAPDPTPVPGLGDNSRVFLVPEPAHLLSPWAFSLVVDAGGVFGIVSPLLYLTRAIPAGGGGQELLTLFFDSDTGLFKLQAGGSVGLLTVDSQQLLVFTVPEEGPLDVEVRLQKELNLPDDVVLTWADSPIVWPVTKITPPWVTFPTPPVSDGVLSMSINATGAGAFAVFQFAIQVLTPAGVQITVRSPDPVLVNATIGDG